MSPKVEVLCDREGSVEFGWVAPGVFFARFVGALSASMCGTYASRVLQALNDVSAFHYFCDVTRLTQYDLAARNAFLKLVLDRRSKFASFTVLTWAEGVSQMARAFSAVFGEDIAILVDRAEFESRLLAKAPAARSRIEAARPATTPASRGTAP